MASASMEILSSRKTATPSSVLRKRKREDEKVLLGDPLVSHSSSVFDSSVKITPTVVIARSYIPFAWLAGVPARLLSGTPSQFPALDIPMNVLIVKVEGERQLSALEKVKDGVYTLYKLSQQLKMKDVRKTVSVARKSTAVCDILEADETPAARLEQDWWTGLVLPDFQLDDRNSYSLAVPACLDMGFCPKNEPEHNKLTPPAQLPPTPPLLPAPELPIEEAAPVQEPSLEDILVHTRCQYYETLYVTKTSLAYFAKSTLSRARVNVHLDDSTSSADSDLIAFLQGMLLPLDKMDIKYKQAIISIALEEPLDDKSAFSAGEEEYVQRWKYASFEDQLVKAGDVTLKHKVEELKIRETELQIILILEILSLRKSINVEEFPVADKKIKKSKKGFKGKGKSKTKYSTPDPEILLDLLVDRLCIWRSVGSVSAELVEEEQSQNPEAQNEQDHLRHFCVEVVLAFYASRLPEKCAYINKKCGGPSAKSSKRPDPSSNFRTKKERRLSTVKKVPSFTRPFTASSATGRDSTPSLEELIAADAAALPKTNARGGTLNSKSFAKREVQIDSRIARKKKVDEELKDAIKVLSRPNRIAAAAEFAETAEKRAAAGAGNKSKRPTTRNPLSKIQVMATPKRRRTAAPPNSIINQLHRPDADPFGGGPTIPSSAWRPGVQIGETPPKRRRKYNLADTVTFTNPPEIPATGQKCKSKSFDEGFVTPQRLGHRVIGTGLSAGNFVPSSSVKIPDSLPRSLSSMAAVPTTPVRRTLEIVTDSSPDGGVQLRSIDETPAKASLPKPMFEPKAVEQERSIYESLGWDDDYDL
ncbi:hypothetical protein RUND412_002278 [Rhizina undulata]